ncbi:MAG: hypothetical protein OEY94_08785 [Alphaproteobacteria bacterium]|nr:hypothetical protein [Alphaproteobacteria bacterium]
MELPAAMAAETALTRQNIALSVIKSSSEQQQALAEIIDDASRSAAPSKTHGTNFNESV